MKIVIHKSTIVIVMLLLTLSSPFVYSDQSSKFHAGAGLWATNFSRDLSRKNISLDDIDNDTENLNFF